MRPSRSRDVVELPGHVRVRGTLAWLAWLILHLVTLLGNRNRLSALANLSYRYLAWGRGGGFIVDDHRMVFRQHQKEHLIRAANVMALLGLATVALSISAAVMLVVSYVTRAQWAGAVIAACVVCMFGGLWFAFPLSRRRPERT